MDKELKFSVSVDGNKVELKVVKPNYKQKMESEKVKNTVFRQAMQSGAYLMTELDNDLKKRGFWDDEKDAKFKELQADIRAGVSKLNEGGFDIDEAKVLALEVSRKRIELANLATIRGDFADKTADGQAQNASFDYLISQCVVYNDSGKQYFSSYDDYVARKGDDDANECAQKFYELLYNRISDDAIQSLPENQFLKEFGFVDDKMRLINDKGQLIDDNGRLIDEDGNWINDEGKKIDFYGNLLDEKGKPILNRKPFTKAGQPIIKNTDEKEEVVQTEVQTDA